MSESHQAVRTLLNAVGLHLSEEDIEALATDYPALRASVDKLYGVTSGSERPLLEPLL